MPYLAIKGKNSLTLTTDKYITSGSFGHLWLLNRTNTLVTSDTITLETDISLENIPENGLVLKHMHYLESDTDDTSDAQALLEIEKEKNFLQCLHSDWAKHIFILYSSTFRIFALIMPFQPGKTIEKIETLTLSSFLKLSRSLVLAMEHMHEKKIVHLDLKPANIILTSHDDLRIVDLGVSEKPGELFYQEPANCTLQHLSPDRIAQPGCESIKIAARFEHDHFSLYYTLAFLEKLISDNKNDPHYENDKAAIAELIEEWLPASPNTYFNPKHILTFFSGIHLDEETLMFELDL